MGFASIIGSAQTLCAGSIKTERGSAAVGAWRAGSDGWADGGCNQDGHVSFTFGGLTKKWSQHSSLKASGFDLMSSTVAFRQAMSLLSPDLLNVTVRVKTAVAASGCRMIRLGARAATQELRAGSSPAMKRS